MKKNYVFRFVVPILISLGCNLTSSAQVATTFSYTGSVQYYTVPPGVSSVQIQATGAGGANSNDRLSTSHTGGKGSTATGTLAVTPGQVLQVYVGGAGNTSGIGGFNGGGSAGLSSAGGSCSGGYGGGGGGASDVRLTGLTDRFIVAAGGGGAGRAYCNGSCQPCGCGGSGGPGDANGTAAGNCGFGYSGGAINFGGKGLLTSSANGGPGDAGGNSGTAGTLGVGGTGATGTQDVSGGGGGGGYYGGGGGGGAQNGSGVGGGGGGGGSSYTGGVTGGVTTSNVNAGDGQVVITQLCITPGAIVGPSSVCLGSTATLTNPTSSGGTWVSSNPTAATINSVTGLVTGLSLGTTNITYVVSTPCGGVSASVTITVSALPAALPSTTSVCQGGGTVTLTDATPGGSWSSASPTTATVGSSTGLVTGLVSGSTTVSYTLPSGCSATTLVTVNPLPAVFSVTGGGTICTSGGAGVHVGLSGSASGVTYQLFNGASPVGSAAGTGSSIDFGAYNVTGTYTVVASNTATGCTSNMTGSAAITANPPPAAITGPTNLCVGSTITLSDATSGGTWSTTDPSKATVVAGSGVVTGVFAGTVTISYTLTSTGCGVGVALIVNPLPTAIVGASSVCVGSSTTLSDFGTGTWSSSNPGLASIGASTGLLTGISTGVANITYAFATGCATSTSITVNGLPDSTNVVTGGGSFCSGGMGVHVNLSYSNIGVNYQLFRGGVITGTPLAGSNSSLDMGLQTVAGTYTIKGTNSMTGCSSTMTGSVNVTVLTSPTVYNMTGGGSYCAGGTGVSIGLNGSSAGIKYQLYSSGSPVGAPVPGTGSLFSFGIFTTAGSYNTVATDTVNGCSISMSGTETVSVNILPAAYNVTGGGSFCSGTGTGVAIGLSASDPGNTYSLMLAGATVTSVVSTGGAISFGNFTTPGLYTVVGRDGTTLCTNLMNGSATVVVNPSPTVYSVTGGGGYCTGGTGVHIGLSYSGIGINYQLWSGPTPIGSVVAGTGASLNLGLIATPGTYTVTAVNPVTLCGSNMSGSATVSIQPPPISYNITGGGSYCAGSPGLHIGTNFTQAFVQYQLYRGGVPVGSPVTGAGPGIDFGAFTTAGTYTAVATIPSTGCSANLSGTAVITANALPTAYTVTGGGYFCAGDTGRHILLSGSDTSVNYELFYNGVSTGTVIPGTGTGLDFGLQTAGGIYTVKATNTLTTCNRSMSGSASLIVNPAPFAYNTIGGGGYCPGAPAPHIGLDGSATGYSYQLYNGSLASGLPLSGSGTAVDFGTRTVAGVYTVVATNLITGCTGSMNGSSTISINPTPNDYAISPAGSYCAGGAGFHLQLPSGSDAGVNYQLYLGGAPVGPAVTGTGTGAVDFGFHTAAGVYTAIATSALGCTEHMPGAAVINIVSPAVFAVTGGGSFCSGGAGVPVGLSGSAASETYQLISGTTLIGPALPGTGAAISFGPQTLNGSYIVRATNTMYGCTDTMAGSVNVVVNALPAINVVGGGGSYCAGSTGPHVTLNGSVAGIRYQLNNGGLPTGMPVNGTGIMLDFGAQTAAGSYTVVATNIATTCTDTMAGSVAVSVKPVPHRYLVSIENYGNYCAADSGLHISLPASDTGVSYQLYRGSATVGTAVAGTGSNLNMGLESVAGVYTIYGTNNTSGCRDSMLGNATLNIIPLPTVYNVTGGGDYCRGGTGVHVYLDGSEPAVYYQLYDGPYSAGGQLGSGSPLDFGLQTATGNYVVVGNSVITDCPNNMFGQATIGYIQLLTPMVAIRAFPGTGIGVWHVDSIRVVASNAGTSPTYQWLINGNIIPGATNESFTNHVFYNNDSVTCLVTASGPCGGNTTAQSLILTLYNVGVPSVNTAAADIKLIPNPNKGVFTVKGSIGYSAGSGNEEVTLEVVDIMGQVLHTEKTTAQNGKIDRQITLGGNIANGMYLLNVRSAGGRVSLHFVVEQ